MPNAKWISRRRMMGAGGALLLAPLAGRAASSGQCTSTPRQTMGPFFPIHDQADKDVDLTRLPGHEGRAKGEVIRVRGRILDESCAPVSGALVDLWQADVFGRYRHPADPNPAQPDPGFQGWGQAVTDADGRYSFTTIKPASYPLQFLDGRPDEEAGFRTPHIHFRISKRGYVELSTQMYFAGEKLNETDGVLSRITASDRPRVIIAPDRSVKDGSPVFVFDVAVRKA